MDMLWKIPFARHSVPLELNEKYNPLLAGVLALRNITDCKEAEDFLSIQPDFCFSPDSLPDIDKAIQRINLAILHKETVAVYGDYDVDGITATCLLTDYLSSCGVNCIPYIPERKEGYGLNKDAVNKLHDLGVSLIITVDCGITATFECELAKNLKMDVVITDHHECKNGLLPCANAIVCNKLPVIADNDKNRNLAGVGVAFMLAYAHAGHAVNILEKYCDLVAIGTIADVMPLDPQNRFMVKTGIKKLNTSPRLGIQSLIAEAKLTPGKLTATSVGFAIAPRLNAAGRLENAKLALDLLYTGDKEASEGYAKNLCELNTKRQIIEHKIWEDIRATLEHTPPSGPIVLSSNYWNQGVIGILASRLSEQYHVPAIMIRIDDDGMGKGSCRSYSDFNLYDALSACASELESFGGHALAAGLNIREERIESFKNMLSDYYFNNPPSPKQEIECDILLKNADDLTVSNVESLSLLEPYGNENKKPLFCLYGASIQNIHGIGNEKRHLKFSVCQNGTILEGIWFSSPPLHELGITANDLIDIAFYPQVNEYRDTKNVQLLVTAMRKHCPDEFCSAILGKEDCAWVAAGYVPERSDAARVWHALEANNGIVPAEYEDVKKLVPADVSPEKTCLALMVFLEAGLLTSPDGSVLGAKINRLSKKADLESTELMQKLRDAAITHNTQRFYHV